MAEYIDRDAVYDAILIDGRLNAYGKAYCLDIVKKIPSADVVPNCGVKNDGGDKNDE